MSKAKIKFVDTYAKQVSHIEDLLKGVVDYEISDNPDFLFYSVFGSGIEHYKYDDCIKIFISGEGVVPDFNECDYAVAEYPMTVGDRYFCKPYNSIKEYKDFSELDKSAITDRKFCNFIFSNDSKGAGAILRKEFCRKLMEYKHVDCPGKVLNNMMDVIEPRTGDWYYGKLKFIKNYKFTIAFENVNTPGMVSEKIDNAFISRSVPIYWGSDNVNDIYNPESFINCSGLSIDEMVQKVIEIDQDDEKYLKMLNTYPINPEFNINWRDDLQAFFKRVLSEDAVRYEKNPLGFDSGTKAAKEILELRNGIGYKFYKNKKKVINKINNKLNKR